MKNIAIFGGTFDPVHNGHIKTSLSIQSCFNFDTYFFLPCKSPVIKAPSLATNKQRVDMLQIALQNYQTFKIDLREINRDSPSYMVHTLEHFRNEYKEASITLILGYDALISLPKWYHWKELILLANLLVINRPEFSEKPIPSEITEFIKKHEKKHNNEVLTNKSGVIVFFDAGNHPISSTAIRNAIKDHHVVDEELPKAVYQYIIEQGLYQ